MPTPKQTREHYKKCRRAFYRLLTVLNEAHNLKVIDYEEKTVDGKWTQKHESVCELIHKGKSRFELATARQLTEALKTELMSELKGVW